MAPAMPMQTLPSHVPGATASACDRRGDVPGIFAGFSVALGQGIGEIVVWDVARAVVEDAVAATVLLAGSIRHRIGSSQPLATQTAVSSAARPPQAFPSGGPGTATAPFVAGSTR